MNCTEIRKRPRSRKGMRKGSTRSQGPRVKRTIIRGYRVINRIIVSPGYRRAHAHGQGVLTVGLGT